MGPKWDSRFELKPGKWVFVPSDESIELGKKIKAQMEGKWEAPPYYFHLREGGHVAALRSHIDQESFIHLDIQNFFDSINRSRITRCLKRRFGYDGAREIAMRSTVLAPGVEEKKYILPYGFVQSPILASICLFESALGRFLRQLARREGTKVSVYVDDIIISTEKAEQAVSILNEVKQAAARAGFRLNADKEEGPAHKISAFNIELSQHSLAITHERWEEFLESYRTAENDHQREGILGYVESVNAEQAQKLIDA